MDPLIKSQLLYQLSYTPVPAPDPGSGGPAARARKIRENAVLARRTQGAPDGMGEGVAGAVDFAYLERFAAGDRGLVGEVLDLFAEQAAIWRLHLAPEDPAWRDVVHTLKGSARGIGAHALGEVCAQAEQQGAEALPQVVGALDAALAEIAAYRAA